ncbi:hypothetical protein HG531_003317 [Fusarium graminearum]|nr:hypothetical protein HG531_003317 [Fusarium graminearum]
MVENSSLVKGSGTIGWTNLSEGVHQTVSKLNNSVQSTWAGGLREHLKFTNAVTLAIFSQSSDTTTSTLAFLDHTQASVENDVDGFAFIGFVEENLASIDLNPFQSKVNVQDQAWQDIGQSLGHREKDDWITVHDALKRSSGQKAHIHISLGHNVDKGSEPIDDIVQTGVSLSLLYKNRALGEKHNLNLVFHVVGKVMGTDRSVQGSPV